MGDLQPVEFGYVADVPSEPEDAEAVLERLVIARETVTELLAQPCRENPEEVVTCRDVDRPKAAVVTGAVVPHRREGLTVTVLSPDYQRIMAVLEGAAIRAMRGLRCSKARLIVLPWPAASRSSKTDDEPSVLGADPLLQLD